VARKVEEKNTYRVSAMKLEGNSTVLRSGSRWVILRWISKTEAGMNWIGLIWLIFGNMTGLYDSNEWAFATYIYEMATLFIGIEINSVTSAQNCTAIYNGTIIALFIDITLPAAIWRWRRFSL
jgi:hypothetical protein